MFCKNCGSSLPDGSRFCAKCGVAQEITEGNWQQPVFMDGTLVATKKKSKAKWFFIFLVIIFAIILLALIIRNGDEEEQTQKAEITITAISSTSTSITYDFENISDRDIAYITFETYFYDQMGGALDTTWGGEYLSLKYTGPLYAGETDSAYWNYVLDIPTGTAVVYPKYITVTFIDGEEVSFKNDLYSCSDGFYGGELRD